MSSGQTHATVEDSNHNFKDGWFVRLLEYPPRTRTTALMTIAALVVAFGMVDHFTGPLLMMIFFYIIPIVLGSAWFGARAGYAVALACSVTHSIADFLGHAQPYTWVTLWNRVFVLIIYFGAARCVAELMALQRHLGERVQARTRELEKALAAQTELQNKIGAASRYERNAIGRELHDGLCQQLAATNIAAGMLAGKFDGMRQAGAAEDVRAISGMLADAIAQTRQIARGLLLAAIKPADLDAELRELCRNASRKHKVACDFSRTGGAPAINEAEASHLFFIAQEALRNALKHACASSVEIRLCANEQAGAIGTVDLIISDDGRGFAASVVPSTAGAAHAGEKAAGLGMEIMRHRAELIGAQFDIESDVAGRAGTRVRCALPIRTARAQEGVA